MLATSKAVSWTVCSGAVPAADTAEDDTEDAAPMAPVRHIRSVVRDANGFITAVVDEQLEES